MEEVGNDPHSTMLASLGPRREDSDALSDRFFIHAFFVSCGGDTTWDGWAVAGARFHVDNKSELKGIESRACSACVRGGIRSQRGRVCTRLRSGERRLRQSASKARRMFGLPIHPGIPCVARVHAQYVACELENLGKHIIVCRCGVYCSEVLGRQLWCPCARPLTVIRS